MLYFLYKATYYENNNYHNQHHHKNKNNYHNYYNVLPFLVLLEMNHDQEN